MIRRQWIACVSLGECMADKPRNAMAASSPFKQAAQIVRLAYGLILCVENDGSHYVAPLAKVSTDDHTLIINEPNKDAAKVRIRDDRIEVTEWASRMNSHGPSHGMSFPVIGFDSLCIVAIDPLATVADKARAKALVRINVIKIRAGFVGQIIERE